MPDDHEVQKCTIPEAVLVVCEMNILEEMFQHYCAHLNAGGEFLSTVHSEIEATGHSHTLEEMGVADGMLPLLVGRYYHDVEHFNALRAKLLVTKEDAANIVNDVEELLKGYLQ